MKRKQYIFLTISLVVTLILGLFSVSTGRAFLLKDLNQKKDRYFLITNVIADHHWFSHKDHQGELFEDEEVVAVVKGERPPPKGLRVSSKVPRDKLTFASHIVRKGETLSSIASLYGVDVATLKGSNEFKNHNFLLKIGQELKVPNQKGILYKVRRGQTLWDISKAFKLPIDKISHLNNLKNPGKLKTGAEIFLPGSGLLLQKANLCSSSYTRHRQKANFSRSSYSRYRYHGDGEGFIIPIAGRISSRFGYRLHPIYYRRMFHDGLDIAAPYGREVVAAKSGQVIFAGWKGGYGRTVIIKHDRKYSTLYAHNAALLVKRGQYVKKGQPIARIGSTGISTGNHLHFEVRAYNRPQDPLKYLP